MFSSDVYKKKITVSGKKALKHHCVITMHLFHWLNYVSAINKSFKNIILLNLTLYKLKFYLISLQDQWSRTKILCRRRRCLRHEERPGSHGRWGELESVNVLLFTPLTFLLLALNWDHFFAVCKFCSFSCLLHAAEEAWRARVESRSNIWPEPIRLRRTRARKRERQWRREQRVEWSQRGNRKHRR